MKIVAAFRRMNLWPGKHSYAWLRRKCDYGTDIRTDRQTPDKVIPMCCYAGDTKMRTKLLVIKRCIYNAWWFFFSIHQPVGHVLLNYCQQITTSLTMFSIIKIKFFQIYSCKRISVTCKQFVVLFIIGVWHCWKSGDPSWRFLLSWPLVLRQVCEVISSIHIKKNNMQM